MADMEARMAGVEHGVSELDRRVTNNESDIKCIKNEWVEYKLSMARIETLLTTNAQNHNDTLALLKWIVIIAMTVIAALAGIKIILPNM